MSRDQNANLPMWFGDGMTNNESEQLTNMALLPQLLSAPNNEVVERYRFVGRALAKSRRVNIIIPLPLDAALFAVLQQDSPREIVKAFAVSNLNEHKNYQSTSIGSSLPPFTCYDILNVVFDVWDEVQALASDPDRDTKMRDLANRRVSAARGGWLATMPRAFDWLDPTNEKCIECNYGDATTDTILSLFTQEDLTLCISFLDLVQLAVPSLMDFGPLKVTNLDQFMPLFEQAIGEALLPQIVAFREGIEDVLPLSSFDKFYPNEIKVMLCGEDTLDWDVEKMLNDVFNFAVDGASSLCTKGDNAAKVLADVCVEFDDEQRFRLVEFVTGLMRPGGDLKIGVVPHNANTRSEEIPRSRACLPALLHVCDYWKIAENPDIIDWEAPRDWSQNSSLVKPAFDSARVKAQAWRQEQKEQQSKTDVPTLGRAVSVRTQYSNKLEELTAGGVAHGTLTISNRPFGMVVSVTGGLPYCQLYLLASIPLQLCNYTLCFRLCASISCTRHSRSNAELACVSLDLSP